MSQQDKSPKRNTFVYIALIAIIALELWRIYPLLDINGLIHLSIILLVYFSSVYVTKYIFTGTIKPSGGHTFNSMFIMILVHFAIGFILFDLFVTFLYAYDLYYLIIAAIGFCVSGIIHKFGIENSKKSRSPPERIGMLKLRIIRKGDGISASRGARSARTARALAVLCLFLMVLVFVTPQIKTVVPAPGDGKTDGDGDLDDKVYLYSPTLTVLSDSPTIDRTVELGWSAVIEADVYSVYRHDEAITSLNIEDSDYIGFTASLYYTDIVSGSGIYFYSVVASNLTHVSLPSNSPFTIINDPPGPPSPFLTIDSGNPSYSTGVDLSWTASTGADNYTLWRMRDAIYHGNIVNATPIHTSSNLFFNDTVPSTGVWFYAVTATNISGTSLPSNSPFIIIQSPPTYPPSAPFLTIDTPSPSTVLSVDLSWTASTGADNYTLCRMNESIYSGNIGSSTVLGTFSNLFFNDTVPSTGSWFYSVIANNETGSSGPSNSPYIEVRPPPSVPSEPPAVPVLSVDSPSPSSDLTVDLHWTDTGDNYTLYRHDEAIYTGNLGSSTILTAGTTNLFYNDTVPSIGIWFYAVTSTNGTGVSGPSNSPYTIIQSGPVYPPSPQILTIDTPSPSADFDVDLHWTVDSLADNYTLYRHDEAIYTGNLGSATILTAGTINLFYNDTVPSTGIWFYAVVSTNETGSSSPSNSPYTIITSSSSYPPSAPLVTIDTPSPSTAFSVDLHWTNTGADSYAVYRYNQAIYPGNLGSSTLLSVTSNLFFNDSVPSVGTWFYAVVSINGSGNSTPSNSPYIVIQSVPSLPPSVPILTINEFNPTYSKIIDLSWTASPGAFSYTLYRHTEGIHVGNLGSAEVIAITAVTYWTDIVPACGIWFYAVTSTNATGTSAPSNSPYIYVKNNHDFP